MSFDRASRIAWMKKEARERILLLDGSWGVMIQGYGLSEDDFRGERFGDHRSDLKGNNDLLTLTRPTSCARSASLSRRRRGLHRNQHLQFHLDVAGRLRPRTSRPRIERRRRASGARALRRG